MNLTTPLRVIIVEDLPLLRQGIERFMRQQQDFIVVGTCGTVNNAIGMIQTTKPDLLLLDIRLPDGTGFDILEKIPGKMRVIFLTAYEEYTIRALRYGAIDYLLKPLDYDELRDALQRVIDAEPLFQEQIDVSLKSYKKKKGQDHIVVRSQQCAEILWYKEIIYLQADNSYTTFFLKDGKKVVSTKSIKEYEELLPDASFMRTHQSYMVNKLYVYRYYPKESIIHLKDGTQIPVSTRKREMVQYHLRSGLFKFW